MIRYPYLFLLLISALSVIGGCKKTKSTAGARTQQQSTDKPLATAFVTKSPIVVYESADTKSKVVSTLPIGVQVAVFASRVPDKAQPDQSFWYKVRYTPLSASLTASSLPVEGYVSEREEVLRNNLMVFSPASNVTYRKETAPGKFEDVEESQSVIATTSVNLRQSPALNAPILRTLKNGEVLSLEEQSGKTYLVDKKNGYWYKLRSTAGEVGYAFGGFLVSGPVSEIQKLEQAGFQFQSGWITPLGNKGIVYAGPVGNARIQITEDAYYIPDAWRRSNGLLEKDIYMKADGLTTKGEPQRYRIALRQQTDYEVFQEHYFYVDKSAVKFTRDYYGVSEKQPHQFDAELAPLVNKFVGGNLNLQCSSVQEFSGGPAEAPRQFKVINASIGASSGGADESSRCASNDKQTLVAEVINDKLVLSKSERGEFRDLDGDQVPEIVSADGGRGYQTLDIYSIKQGKTILLAAFRSEHEGMNLFGGFSVDDQGFLHIDEPYECRSDNSAPDGKKQCAEIKTKIRSTVKFLKFDAKLPAFPFKGRLEGDKFVQVADENG